MKKYQGNVLASGYNCKIPANFTQDVILKEKNGLC
jgi:hypothetical protein